MHHFRIAFYFIVLLIINIPLSAQETSGVMDAVAFSPDGTVIASGGRDGLIRLWDAENGKLLRQLKEHPDWISSVLFSPDGTQIISASRDNKVRLFDADTGAFIRVIGLHSDDVTALAMNPDGTVIASGGRNGTIHLWDSTTGQLIQSINQFERTIWHLAFDPTETYLATSSDDGNIWLRGLSDENSGWLKQMNGHTAPVTTFAFSPDGDSILSGGLDGTVRLWDVSDLSADTFEPILTMSGHLAPVTGVGFSADSEVVISASLDGTVRLWDLSGAVEIGRELSVISGSGTPLTNLALNPGNTRAVSVSTDGSLIVWDMSPDAFANIETASIPQTYLTIPGNSIEQPSPANEPFLTIPSVGISTGITTFLLEGASWAVDPNEPLAGHLQGTAWLDDIGNTVLSGHAGLPDGSPGVFENLDSVGIGDIIFLQDVGVTRRYVVVNILSVTSDDLSPIFPTDFNRPTLTTCDESSPRTERNICRDSLVVIADEVPL